MVDIASIKVKLIIGLVVVGIIGGLGFALNYQMDKVDKLQIKVNTLTEANKTLTDTIETNKKLDKISDDIQLKLDKDVSEAAIKQDNIQDNVDKDVKDIEKKYTELKKEVYKPKIKKDDSKTVVEPEPTVSELEIAETNEISQVRINALWDSYCQSEPTNSQCVK